MKLNKREQQILLHTTGLSYLRVTEKNKLTEKLSRNYFYTSQNSDDFQIICNLLLKGLMFTYNMGWDDTGKYFYATDRGIKEARKIAEDNFPKLPKSKLRYKLYLHSESIETFIEWLKNPYWDDYRKRHGC